MYQIHLVNQDVTAEVAGGTLAQACADAGFPLNLVCGGNGTCGKCKVTVEFDGKRRQVLACKTEISRDMSVFLDDEQISRTAAIMTEGRSAQHIDASPSVSKKCLSRQELLPEHCGAYLPSHPLSFLRQFSALISERNTTHATFVSFRGTPVAVEVGDTTSALYGGAVDIGTTSVVLYAYDLNTGTLLSTKSALNGQIARGADVITRIQYAQESADGLQELNGLILNTINDLLRSVEQEIPGFCAQLYHMVLCGNSTMQHLFLGLSPSGLACDPFVSITAAPVRTTGAETGLRMAADGVVEFLPLLGGFVGADTSAVLLTLPQDEKRCLMVDLGTNGEIAVGMAGKYRVASTACGPALEGGNISCGMRGMEGAIEHISLADDRVSIQVIGGGKAKGLCGSAIIDAVAELLRVGIIDESGRLLSREDFLEEHPGSALAEHLKKLDQYSSAFFFVSGETPVYLSQHDVRQIQLAKSSILSGCITLLKESGLTVADVDALYLAGAFGNYIDVDHALEIGLLPPVPRTHIHSIGNGAGLGARLCLLDHNQMTRCIDLVAHTEHLELASSPQFMEEYIMNMNFASGGAL